MDFKETKSDFVTLDWRHCHVISCYQSIIIHFCGTVTPNDRDSRITNETKNNNIR